MKKTFDESLEEILDKAYPELADRVLPIDPIQAIHKLIEEYVPKVRPTHKIGFGTYLQGYKVGKNKIIKQFLKNISDK